jgi:hypothetical protein
MAKRFTDSEKWSDKWYRTLSPCHKLAWHYVLDCCDHAGVFERDDELAEFRIGCAVDWDDFIKKCGKRVVILNDEKLFIVGFIGYQYGVVSRECRAHNPVYASIEKHGLSDRVFKGYPEGIQRGQDKDKDKERIPNLKKKEGVVDDEWVVPPGLDCDLVRSLLDDFEAMRKRIGKPIRSRESTSRILKQFASVEHLAFALETCIANDYQGLKPEYRPASLAAGNGSVKKTFAQQSLENSLLAMERFVNE